MNRISRGVIMGVAVGVALISAGLVAFLAWPSSSQHDSARRTPVPLFVRRFAHQQHVTKLVGHGWHDFALFSGRDRDGKAVVSVSVGAQWLTPFTPAGPQT